MLVLLGLVPAVGGFAIGFLFSQKGTKPEGAAIISRNATAAKASK